MAVFISILSWIIKPKLLAYGGKQWLNLREGGKEHSSDNPSDHSSLIASVWPDTFHTCQMVKFSL